MRKQFTFRMDDRIYYYIKERAKVEKRSMNNMMEFLFEKIITDTIDEEIEKEKFKQYDFINGRLILKETWNEIYMEMSWMWCRCI